MMRGRPAFLAALLLVALSSTAFAADPKPVAGLTEPQLKKIIPDRSQEIDLKGFLSLQQAKPPAVIIDLRAPESFVAKHIKGSVNMPLTALTETSLPALAPDKNANIVLVCDNSFFPTRRIAMTLQAYPVLVAAGYRHIYRLNLWQSAENHIRSEADIEKAVPFAGTAVLPAPEKHTDYIFTVKPE